MELWSHLSVDSTRKMKEISRVLALNAAGHLAIVSQWPPLEANGVCNRASIVIEETEPVMNGRISDTGQEGGVPLEAP